MRFTNSFLSSVSKELKYQSYSKVLWISLVVALFISTINLYGLKTNIESAYDLYLKTKVVYTEEGVDVEKMLSEPINFTMEGNSQTTDNPVRYQFNKVADTISLLNGKAIITQTLEWMNFVFFPLIFGLYSINTSTYDYRFGTINIKSVRYKRSILITSKLVSSYLGIILIFGLTLMYSYVFGIIMHNQATHMIISEDLARFEYKANNNNLSIQLLFSIGICILFSTIGSFFGFLFKSTITATIVFFTYDLLVPVLGNYDLRNLISVIAHKLFDFNGRFQLFNPMPVPTQTAIIILLFFYLIILALSYVLFSKQSKYNS